VNEGGIWPLELSCRFGYPGYAILEPLQKTPWSVLLQIWSRVRQPCLQTETGFSVGIVMTTRPIIFEGALSERDRKNIHFGEMGQIDGELVTAGAAREAQAEAYRLAERVRNSQREIPQRYRHEIGGCRFRRNRAARISG
jgi:phosphoribosylamine---glycine ligase